MHFYNLSVIFSGIMSSRIKLHPSDHKQGVKHIKSTAKEYCDDALKDVHFIEEQANNENTHLILNQYHLIRYEDLSKSPQAIMESLYKFLGIKPDEKLLEWVKQQQLANTNGNKTSSDGTGDNITFGTERKNPAYTSTRWREMFKYKHVKEVQSSCKDFMDVFGYYTVRLNDEGDLRNDSFSLLEPIKKYLLREYFRSCQCYFHI